MPTLNEGLSLARSEGARRAEVARFLGQRLRQVAHNELRQCPQGFENANALLGVGDGFEGRFIADTQLFLHFLNRNRVGRVSLVQLNHIRDVSQVIALELQILLQLVETLDVGVHPIAPRVGDEDDAVDSLENELSGSPIKILPRNRK